MQEEILIYSPRLASQCDTSGVPKAVHMRNHFHVGIKVIWKFQANRLPSASTANNASIPDLQNLEHPPSKASPTGSKQSLVFYPNIVLVCLNDWLYEKLHWMNSCSMIMVAISVCNFSDSCSSVVGL